MKVLEIIGYILIVVGVLRLLTNRGYCPGGWSALAIGVLLVALARGKSTFM